MAPRSLHRLLAPLLAAAAASALPPARGPQEASAGGEPSVPRPFALAPARLAGVGEVLRGRFGVHEDRERRAGRVLELEVVVLPALTDDPRPDPVFFLAGGPGQAATALAPVLAGSWMRAERDLVLVDQRGTAGNHRLACALPPGAELPQVYLRPLVERELLRPCLEELRARADLRLYSTPIAMDDLDDVRAALGYERINLCGGSYGTRAALVYMRRHPERVRCAVLDGVAPIAFTNPLFHARSAQEALDGLLAACAADPDCGEAFPELERELAAVLRRLDKAPAKVTVAHPDTGERVRVELDRQAFAESLRFLMYSWRTAGSLPAYLHRAAAGDLEPFAREAIRTNRALFESVAIGMLLSVVCAEDVARIDPEDVARETAGTFLGDFRVRQQMELCAAWPRSELPEDYGEPVRSDVPVLLLSGTLDPVTPPRWGEEAARHLPRSLHLVLPGAHGVGDGADPCVRSILLRFLEAGSADGLDVECAKSLRLPPFAPSPR